MTTCTTASLVSTLNNLHLSGTFVRTNATLATAIPPTTIGTHQLIDQTISELVTMKNSIKKNEKALLVKLNADNDFSGANADITLAGDTTSNDASHEGVTNSTARGGNATPASNPAIIIGGSRQYAESAIFDLLSYHCHELMKVNTDSALAGADPGAATIA